MVNDLHKVLIEVGDALDEAIMTMAKNDYNAFILLIGRADIEPTVKELTGSECVIDYRRDLYYDRTREGFYIRYLNKNYQKAGYDYLGDSGIDDLSIEMMIYTHIWDSVYFLKSLYRIAYSLSGKGYCWNASIPEKRRYEFIIKQIVEPLSEKGFKLGEIIKRGYKSSIRNAFAHALYTVDEEKREINLRPSSSPFETLSFEAFQSCFLYSAVLSYLTRASMEKNHDEAAKKNAVLTNPFLTPDGVNVCVRAETQLINGTEVPRFFMARVKSNC